MSFKRPEEVPDAKSLADALLKVGYVTDEKFAGTVLTALETKPVGGAFLSGPPGVGKSYLPVSLAKVLNCPIVKFQVFSGMPDEALLIRHTVDEEGKVKAAKGPLVEALELSQKEPVILLINEIDKARPSADNVFLDALQEGYVNYLGRKIQGNLDNLLVFFTTNNNRAIEPALLRRLPWIEVPPMSPSLLEELLRRDGFTQEEIGLGIKLYVAGFQAELERPVTYQEVSQFLRALRRFPQADITSLINAYLIKGDREELEKYLYALKNMPDRLTWGYEEKQDEESLRRAIEAPLEVVEGKEEEEKEVFSPAYPKVVVRRPQVKVRVVSEEELVVKGGYFKETDEVLDTLNRTGIKFSAVEFKGEKYIVLRKPLSGEEIFRFFSHLDRTKAEYKERIQGEYLCVQDLYVDWETFRSRFDFKEYAEIAEYDFRPFLLYSGKNAIRVVFKGKGEDVIADVLLRDKNRTAVMEVHVKKTAYELVDKWKKVFLWSLVEEFKRRREEEERLRKEEEEKRKKEKEKEAGKKGSENDGRLQELLKSLNATVQEVNGKSYVVVPLKDYFLDEDNYKPFYEDFVIRTYASWKDDKNLMASVYVYLYAPELEGRRFRFIDLSTFSKVCEEFKAKERPNDSKWEYYHRHEDKLGLVSSDIRHRYMAYFRFSLDRFGLPPTEQGIKEATEQAVAKVLEGVVMPYVDHLRERKRFALTVQSANEGMEAFKGLAR